MSKKESDSFEKNLQDLEEIVEKLEKGEIELDESLKMFESGVELYKKCKKKLSNVEKKIQVLSDSLKEEDL